MKNIPAKTKIKNNYFWEQVTAGLVLVSVVGFCGLYPRPKLSATHPFSPPTHFEDSTLKNEIEKICKKINKKYNGIEQKFQYYATSEGLDKIVEDRYHRSWKKWWLLVDNFRVMFLAQYNEEKNLWTAKISIPEEYIACRKNIKNFLLYGRKLPDSEKRIVMNQCINFRSFKYPEVKRQGAKILPFYCPYYVKKDFDWITRPSKFEFIDKTVCDRRLSLNYTLTYF
eukprot:GHVP01064611.1.p1 GENE.GHVP01064611.1~~GHVP01064611.1.p1  ORF type:complete len:260 (-),score=37.03 GHVP01064611.1:593-1270(-)